MKFVHIADMHLDSPFTLLNKNRLGQKRRTEQMQALKKVIEYIKENNIEYLFICGDLYEHEYIKQSTIEYVNNLFKQIESTKIYIVPGNHDPKIKNSYYEKYNWNDNVYIFSRKIEKIEQEEIDIYGYGFDDFYIEMPSYEELKIENKEKINILLTHADLDGAGNKEIIYNPISKTKLQELGYNYVALGHIHKLMQIQEGKTIIAYPGSTISLGFDELGKHGMIVGDINIETKEIKTEFIIIDEAEFIEQELNIDEILTKEELIEKINTLELQENRYYKIILQGNRNFEIDTNEILKQIENIQIIKIKDKTKIKIDLEELAKQNNLKGLFVRELLEKIKQNPEEKEKIEKAIEIGLESFQ